MTHAASATAQRTSRKIDPHDNTSARILVVSLALTLVAAMIVLI